MLDKQAVDILHAGLKRIFSMKVTRSSYREVQNVIVASAQGDKETGDKIFQALLSGEVPSGLAKSNEAKTFKDMAEDYSIPIRLAKDVLERGEFVNLLTSDTLNQNDKVLFLNRVRRIDGDEFQFITDPVSTVHVLQHFIGRMSELNKSEDGRKSMNQLSSELATVRDQLDSLLQQGVGKN
jgi:hypothetical protein